MPSQTQCKKMFDSNLNMKKKYNKTNNFTYIKMLSNFFLIFNSSQLEIINENVKAKQDRIHFMELKKEHL